MVSELSIWWWLGSLSPATERLMALVVAALPGGDILADYLGEATLAQEGSLGPLEAALLAELLQAVAEGGEAAGREAASRFALYLIGGDPTAPDPASELGRVAAE